MVFSSPSSSDRLIFRRPDGTRKLWNDYPEEVPAAIAPYYCKEVIFRSSYACSPSTGRVFAAGQYAPVAEVIGADGIRETAVRLEGTGRNEYEVRDGVPSYRDPLLFYTFTCASRDRFYALFQNARKKEMQRGTSELHVFDLRGNPIRRYALDRRIYHFSVEADDSAVYALGLDDDLLPVLYAYRLPEQSPPRQRRP